MATETDFRIAFNSLLTQAKIHDVDTNDININRFLIHVAGLLANGHALQRDLQNIIHNGEKPNE